MDVIHHRDEQTKARLVAYTIERFRNPDGNFSGLIWRPTLRPHEQEHENENVRWALLLLSFLVLIVLFSISSSIEVFEVKSLFIF